MSGGTTREEVQPIADQIERYWRDLGYHGVRVWLERRKDAGVMDGWEIKTNIGPDGYPPRKEEAA